MSTVAPARLHWTVIGVTTLLWLAHLVGMAALSGTGCAGGGEAVLHAWTIVLLVPTVALALASGRHARDEESGRFLALLAVGVGAVNAFAIVAEWVPVFVLAACG